MYIVDFLVSAIVLCSIILVDCEDGDDLPATNEELFGKGKCCYFGFDWFLSVKGKMKKACPHATFFSKAKLKKNKLIFTKISQDPEGMYVSIAEGCEDDEVLGIAYLIPTDEFEAFVKTDTRYKGTKTRHSKTKNVEVTLDGRTTNIDCNTFIAIDTTPTKPCNSFIQYFVGLMMEHHFDSNYVGKVSQTPAEPCC